MASSPTNSPPPSGIFGQVWSFLKSFTPADPHESPEQHKAPQIEPHNDLAHRPNGSVDTTGADLSRLIKTVNDLLVYTYWLFGRQGNKPPQPYGATPPWDRQTLAGNWDHRIEQLKDNIHLTGSIAEARARQLQSLSSDLRQAKADQTFVHAHLKELGELVDEFDGLLDNWLPMDVYFINRYLTGYEQNRNAYQANNALQAMDRTVREIYDGLDAITDGQSPWRVIEESIKAHAAQMRARQH